MLNIRCAEIWGGIDSQNLDLETAGLRGSLFSQSADGSRGGDIYYLSVCSVDMLTRIAIADVKGHGVAVSQVSQWLYKALSERMNDSAGNVVLTDLNERASDFGFDALTTAAIVGVLKTDEPQVQVAYAGHTPALIRREADSSWSPVQLDDRKQAMENLPLGVDKATEYSVTNAPIQSGDQLIVYTDGFLEAPDPTGALFGSERLAETLTAARGASLPVVKTTLLDAVRKHTGGTLSHDDVTLLAIEVR